MRDLAEPAHLAEMIDLHPLAELEDDEPGDPIRSVAARRPARRGP